MNRLEAADRLAKRFGFTRREAVILVDTILSAMLDALVRGRRVEIRGLGTFGTRQRKSSLGRVVKTGEPVRVPALRRVYFRPGQDLKAIHLS